MYCLDTPVSRTKELLERSSSIEVCDLETWHTCPLMFLLCQAKE